MSTSELRDYATVLAATIATMVFVFNVVSAFRSRRIENIARFNHVHQQLFAPDTYLACNLLAIDAGTLVRNTKDYEMERRFHLMLLEIERLAILANNKAVPRQTQVYMFGSYAPQIQKLLSERERESMYWELAVGYLEGIARDSSRYAKLTRAERAKYWH